MKINAAVLAAFTLAACASGPSGPLEPQGPAAGVDQAERLLAAGRKLKAEKGCAAAAPTFRVIAGFGEGYEVAQYELGSCLIEMTGASTSETGLFREEGLFWLRRAAFANNARAQWMLANVLSGASAATAHGITARPGEALGWALVYVDNPTHKLYGLDPVNPDILAHLNASLPATAIAEAQTFAAEFEPIAMTIFTPPARGEFSQRGEQRPGGFRRRRIPN